MCRKYTAHQACPGAISGPVNGAPGHQNHISRLQGIALALNGIGGAPGKQYQDFVKAVVMPIHRSHDGVLQMK